MIEDRPCLRPLQPPHPFKWRNSICDCHYSASLLYPQAFTPVPFLPCGSPTVVTLLSASSSCSQCCHCLSCDKRDIHPAGSSCSRLHVTPWKSLHAPHLLYSAWGEWRLTGSWLCHSYRSHPCCPKSPNYRFVCVSEEKSLMLIALWQKAFPGMQHKLFFLLLFKDFLLCDFQYQRTCFCP